MLQKGKRILCRTDNLGVKGIGALSSRGRGTLSFSGLSGRDSTPTAFKPCHPRAPEKAPTPSLCPRPCLANIPLSNYNPIHRVGYHHQTVL